MGFMLPKKSDPAYQLDRSGREGPPGTLLGLSFGAEPENDKDFETLLGSRPKSGPDLTDEVVHRAAMAQRLKTGRGRKSTFLTGPAGDTSPLSLGGPTLLGS